MSRPIGFMKTGGREKGTPNKKTLLLSEALESINFDLPLKIVELLPNLSNEKQADILLELMAYVYPKRKATECNLHKASLNEIEVVSTPISRKEENDNLLHLSEQLRMIAEYARTDENDA